MKILLRKNNKKKRYKNKNEEILILNYSSITWCDQ
jgi:hypothetical protein